MTSLLCSCKHPIKNWFGFIPRFVLVFILCVAAIANATADIQSGVDWLVSQQSLDGSYTSPVDAASSFQSTSEALRAFHDLDQSTQPGIPSAQAFLDIEVYRSTENISRLIINGVQTGSDVSTLVTELLLNRNYLDGGFGELSGYNSSILDTAFALEALAVVQHPLGEVTAGAIIFLSDRQGADGGWADGMNESSIYVSALAMHALWYYKNDYLRVSASLLEAKNYLYANQAPTGLWDETFETALALIALITSATEYSEVATLVTELRTRQLPDGSWGGSVYATSLALRALAAQTLPEPPAATTGNITGRVIDINRGNPIVGATATIEALGVSATSNITGEFLLGALSPGEVTIRITALGYTERVYTGTVSAGLVMSLGNVTMSPLPTTAVMQGQITDQQTGLAVAGATVALTGSNNVSVTTDSNGGYSLLNLAPGDIAITVIRPGYYSVAASGTLVAGSTNVFNPILTPANSQEQTSPVSSGMGTLQGVVSAYSGPQRLIPGATVSVSGSTSASTVTASDGSFSITGLIPGEIEIIVSATGYLSVAATAIVAADKTLVFYPVLKQEGGDPSLGWIRGKVVEKGSLTSLPSVVVTINSASVNQVAATNAGGNFWPHGIPADTYTVTFGLAGYKQKSISVIVAAGSTVDLQTIELEKIITSVTVFGAVTDSDTGAPIKNATVIINNTSLTTQTDIDGQYLFEGLDAGSRTLIYSATGYDSQSLVFGFPQFGSYQVDRTLNKSQLGLLNFNSFSHDNVSYKAYEPVNFEITLINSDTAAINTRIEFTILDNQDRVVAVVPATWTGTGNVVQSVFSLEPGISPTITARWSTGITPPGAYRAIARAVVGDTTVGQNVLNLAERVSSFAIEATEAIAEVSVVTLPDFSGVGRTDELSFQARVVNRSNVSTSVSVRYSILSPSQVELHVNSALFELTPQEDNKVMALDSFVHEFIEAGDYPVVVEYLSGTVPVITVGGKVEVAPGIRIQASQNLAPATVTPDEDKRLQINIRLEGVELQ